LRSFALNRRKSCAKLSHSVVRGIHAGATNFVFVDGSVKSIRNSASLLTLTALVTRTGGEVVGNDF
jgi:prepilin-type processing-associated H-X9-DG protein